MNGDEMYQASHEARRKSSDGSFVLENGLSNRVYAALCRAGYGSAKSGCLDVEKLKSDVLSGRIWEAKNVGEKAVQRLCEWLAAQQGGEPTGLADERKQRLYRVTYQLDDDPEDLFGSFYVAAESFAHAETVAGKYLNDFTRDRLAWLIRRIEYVSAEVFPLPPGTEWTPLVASPGVEVERDDDDATDAGQWANGDMRCAENTIR